MIPESMLQNAAKKSYEIYVDQLIENYNPQMQHQFSPKFEKKIKKLKRKADHLQFYRALRFVASILLAITIGGCAWIAVDTEARAAFFGWIKEIYESYFVYKFEGRTDSPNASTDYRPMWLPDGYEEYYVGQIEKTTVVLYKSTDGRMLKFQYASNPDNTNWFLNAEQATITHTTVNGYPAEILVTENITEGSTVLWTDENNTAFSVSAFLSESTLLKVAESVQKKNK